MKTLDERIKENKAQIVTLYNALISLCCELRDDVLALKQGLDDTFEMHREDFNRHLWYEYTQIHHSFEVQHIRGGEYVTVHITSDSGVVECPSDPDLEKNLEGYVLGNVNYVQYQFLLKHLHCANDLQKELKQEFQEAEEIVRRLN